MLKIDAFFDSAAEDVQQLCKAFLLKSGLNYFQYGRVFSDGSTSFLVTHPEFVHARVKQGRGPKTYFAEEHLQKNEYFFLWDGNLPDEDTDLARQFNIYNGLCFIQRYKDYYNMFAFGSPGKNASIINFYLNHIGSLKLFIDIFQDQASLLIKEADEKRVVLPDSLKDKNTQQLLLAPSLKKVITIGSKNIFFSNQEWRCWKELACGKTIKEIAQLLTISPRTVETYLQRVKLKICQNQPLAALYHYHFPDD